MASKRSIGDDKTSSPFARKASAVLSLSGSGRVTRTATRSGSRKQREELFAGPLAQLTRGVGAERGRIRPRAVARGLEGLLAIGGNDETAEMNAIAARLGISLATLAYAWILRHPSRPYPITGSGRLEGLRDAVAALDVRLDTEDWYAIWTASKGHPVP